VSSFVTISVILLLNLLVAQLNRSYEYIYKDMLGFARLNRASLIVDAMESCPKKRWTTFVKNIDFDQRLEFDEGDLGLSGGVASVEPAGAHIQTRESIRRFGGSTSGDMPWPEDKDEAQNEGGDEDDETERLDRIEALVNKIARKVNRINAQGGHGGSHGGRAGDTTSADISNSKSGGDSQMS